ncbi:hypothetical protein ACQZV8_16125 [Magnetococcales bacterium HHB-1]
MIAIWAMGSLKNSSKTLLDTEDPQNLQESIQHATKDKSHAKISDFMSSV